MRIILICIIKSEQSHAFAMRFLAMPFPILSGSNSRNGSFIYDSGPRID